MDNFKNITIGFCFFLIEESEASLLVPLTSSKKWIAKLTLMIIEYFILQNRCRSSFLYSEDKVVRTTYDVSFVSCSMQYLCMSCGGRIKHLGPKEDLKITSSLKKSCKRTY